MDQLRTFLKLTGKGTDKVLAVFSTTAAASASAVRYFRREVPDIPVWLFATTPPDPATAALCDRILVENDSLALLVEAQKALWPRWVALSLATWTGGHLRWPVKLAPFLVPPFRALILNRHGDFLPGTPRNLTTHVRRLVRDALHSGHNRAKDLLRGYALWFFALVAQRFAPLSRRLFLRRHGSDALHLSLPPSEGTEIDIFRYGHRQWNHAALHHLIHHSTARWILFLESEADVSPAGLQLLFGDPRTFAVARQYAFRDWKPALFPIAPFRTLQPGEASQVLAPLSDALLVDRAKLLALGLPRTIVPGTGWMLLFWKAAAAGWRSYALGADRALGEFPDWPYEDAEFVTRVLSEPALRALGPREPELARGAIAFDPKRNGPSSREPRLRVLVVSPYLPWPLSHGGAVRIWNLCRALAGRVDFTLACFREKDDIIDYPQLHHVFREVYVIDREERAGKHPTHPAQVREHASKPLAALIADLCRSDPPDVLQIEFTHLAHFRDAAPQIPAILVEHDLTFTLYRQYAEQKQDRASREEYERWQAFESLWLARYDGIWTMSKADHAQAIAAGAPPDRTFVVANGVDLDRFTPAGAPAQNPEILYIGSFRHRPNILGFERLAQEIMPAVWAKFPNARLTVVAGPEPEKYWTPAQPQDSRIQMHAFVQDVRPLYAKAVVVAVPLRVSAGTNIKVMEAMACGKPVVSTIVGAQGLDLTDGQDILIRDDSPTFAAAIIDLLSNPTLANQLTRNSRATVESRFSWNAIADQALASYHQLKRENQ